MKKFQFSLDTVLDYRHQIQDSLQVELAAITAQVNRQQAAVDAAQGRYAATNQEFREKKLAGMTIAELSGYETALEAAEREIQRELMRLRDLQRKEEAKRQELVQAKQDASSVEKLREKKLEAYRREEQKAEEHYMDDLVCAKGHNASAATS